MTEEKAVFVRCEIRRGGFPSERIFTIRSDDGTTARGVAPAHYFYTPSHTPLGDEPAAGQSISGLVAGVFIGTDPGGYLRVYLPDSEVYGVDADRIEWAKERGAAGVSV